MTSSRPCFDIYKPSIMFVFTIDVLVYNAYSKIQYNYATTSYYAKIV